MPNTRHRALINCPNDGSPFSRWLPGVGWLVVGTGLRWLIRTSTITANKLQDEVDRFNDANWREVVPEVREEVSDVKGDGEELVDRAKELTSALESLESDTEDDSEE